MLSSEFKYITYVDKKGERINLLMAVALESPDNEMTKRLKYTKEILKNMVDTNS